MPNSANTSIPTDAPFRAAYRELERRMKALAECDKDASSPTQNQKGLHTTF